MGILNLKMPPKDLSLDYIGLLFWGKSSRELKGPMGVGRREKWSRRGVQRERCDSSALYIDMKMAYVIVYNN